MVVRTGLQYLVDRVRALAAVADDDTKYTGDYIQAELDRLSKFHRFLPLVPSPTLVAGGTTVYVDYILPTALQDVEIPTEGVINPNFSLYDTRYNPVVFAPGSARYNENTKTITLAEEDGAATYYLSVATFDANTVISELWRAKAGDRAKFVDVKMDNHALSLDQEWNHCITMAAYYAGKAGLKLSRMVRVDNARKRFN